MKYFFLSIIMVVCMFGYSTHVVFADDTDSTSSTVKDRATSQLQAGGKSAGFGDTAVDPRRVVNSVVNSLISLLGVVVTFLFLYAGYLFVISHGEADKLTTARKTMQGAVIGLVLILLSYSIAYFVGKRAVDVTGIQEDFVPPPQMYEVQ